MWNTKELISTINSNSDETPIINAKQVQIRSKIINKILDTDLASTKTKSSFSDTSQSLSKFDPWQFTNKMKQHLNSYLKTEFNTTIDDLNFSQHVKS